MKLLLPIFATLGLFAVACSGGETAVGTEPVEATTTTVAQTTTATLADDVEVPTTTTVAPTTTQATPAEPVGDAEQVVTDAEQVVAATTPTPRPDVVISDTPEKQNEYRRYFDKEHSHDTAEGEITHNHAYYTTAPSHFHRDEEIIYLDLYGDEFTNADVYTIDNPQARYDCTSDGCGKGTQPPSEETVTKTSWKCDPPIPIGTEPSEENGCVKVS